MFEDRDSRFTTYEGVWRSDIEQTSDILADAVFLHTVISIDGKYHIQVSYGLVLWCSTIFQLYRGRQFYWWKKQEDPGKTTDLSQVSDILYHIILYTSPSNSQHQG